MVNEQKKLILFILCIAFLAIFIGFISLSASNIANSILSISSYLGILFVIIALVIFIFLNKLTTVENPQGVFADLIAVLIWLGLTILCIFFPPLNSSIIRVIIALPIILFLPGYALIAALFPQRDDIDVIERITLSFGLSITVVPLMGLVLNYTSWGMRLEPVVICLVLFTIILDLAAAHRRMDLAPEHQFMIPFRQIVQKARGTLTPPSGSRVDRALYFLLLFSILIAVAATIYVITIPKEGEHFTEFYLLGENGKAADYSQDLGMETEYRLIIGIGNHEYRNVTYLVECYLMNMTFDPETNVSHLDTMRWLDTFSVDLSHNTTREIPWKFTVSEKGYNRLEFLLFNETVPNDKTWFMDRINASYRDLHLWIHIWNNN